MIYKNFSTISLPTIEASENKNKEFINIDLWSGENRRDIDGYKNIGIDVVDGSCVDIVCNLGFEDIPLSSNYADFVQGIDFIEHIPKCVWENKQRLLPLVQVMNEVWRIMKNNAELYLETPFSNWAYNRDPTHVAWLAKDWYNYFKADDNLYYDQKIVTCNFKLKDSSIKAYKNPDDILCTRLIAIK